MYLYFNRLDKAQGTAQEARAHDLDSPPIHLILYEINFLDHDASGMEREAAGLMATGFESVVLYYESDTAAYTGRFVKAREWTQPAVQSAERADERELAAQYQAEAACAKCSSGTSVGQDAKPRRQSCFREAEMWKQSLP
jgi:hypothetical protein